MASAIPLEANKGFTYSDYLQWDDGEPWELIGGQAFDMSPAPGRKHQDVSMELSRQLANFLTDKDCNVYAAPFDVRLPEHKEPDEAITTVVQPDISVICDKKKLDERGCRGAPDLIIEIISPFTAKKDMKVKLALYEHHKVKEYWIVHPEDKTVMQYRLGKNKRYGRPSVYTDEDKITTGILPGLEIGLEMVFPK